MIEAALDLGHREGRAHPDGHLLHLRPVRSLGQDTVAVDDCGRQDRRTRPQRDHRGAGLRRPQPAVVTARSLRKHHQHPACVQDLQGPADGLAVRLPAAHREHADRAQQRTQHRRLQEFVLGHVGCLMSERDTHDRRINRAGVIGRDDEGAPGRLVLAALQTEAKEHFAEGPQRRLHEQVPGARDIPCQPAAHRAAVRHRQILMHEASSGRAAQCPPPPRLREFLWNR